MVGAHREETGALARPLALILFNVFAREFLHHLSAASHVTI
jgi:hypothetical protein